jgi:hypothetical protein
MKNKPRPGQVVCLNDYGIEQIGGLSSKAMVEQAQRMTIMRVDEFSLTVPESTFSIDVDQPLINQFMIDNHCVDLVK